MRFRLLAATVAALALAGCGNEPAEPDPAAADAVFSQYVQDQGLTAHGDVAKLEHNAHLICRSYADGLTFPDVLSAIMQGGWSSSDAGEMIGAATAAYCPQYKDKTP